MAPPSSASPSPPPSVKLLTWLLTWHFLTARRPHAFELSRDEFGEVMRRIIQADEVRLVRASGSLALTLALTLAPTLTLTLTRCAYAYGRADRGIMSSPRDRHSTRAG